MEKEIKYLVVCNDGKTYSGTPFEIVCEMSSWDAMCGRVKNNAEYIKLVGERMFSPGDTVNEFDFLKHLSDIGSLTMTEEN